ncbi:MAG: DNA repair protein RecO [Pseudohongiellaceae bacterium]
MDNRVTLQPAYVLHRQAFQNTSLLLDLFCLDYGRVKAVAKGARREKSKYRSSLQPFQPLLLSFSGRGEVKTVVNSEASVGALDLRGQRLFSGLYINELLTRLLHNYVEHKPLYLVYQETLLSLQGNAGLEVLLRKFELALLEELGYGIDFEVEGEAQIPIQPDRHYRFITGVGFEEYSGSGDKPTIQIYRGTDIAALSNRDFSSPEVLAAAKRLLRTALAAHLGDKPLHSRTLFTQRN